MSDGTATEQPLHRSLGLTDDEYQRIQDILGRVPNHAELAMYSVMWSEHCSYKSSRAHLKDLPSEGPHVLIGPGEGAGVIEVDGVAVAMRIESHNHPSFVEPVQGAATGIGGVVRDVVSMGARPIALLDSLRFGPLPGDTGADQTAERNRWLTGGVVSGISFYGNCIGVPTVGGEVKFERSYSGNPLVNVMCIGVAPVDGIMLARAPGPGNAVLLLGSTTGRDGIGGVSVLASASFDEEASTKRPSVQVGDPFTEKLLIEGSLSLIEKDLVVGIQDLGGAGLCCATSESAAKAGTGMAIDLDKVPLRETGMEPFEILTSESQERMLVVVEPPKVQAALDECDRLGLRASVIGEVTDTGRLVCTKGGEVVADVPAASLGDGPLYHRPYSPPTASRDLTTEAPGPDTPPEEALKTLVASANLTSKRWVWEQYDYQVQLNTVAGPGPDAAILRLPGTQTRIAVTVDGNGRYGQVDPREGARHSVAEAYRNLCTMGAEPVAVTNCMNFGNPEIPEVMWQFVEAVQGMGEACRVLETPITGGNVSFYNQTLDEAIYPTPIIGMLGIVKAGTVAPPIGFRNEEDVVVLLGRTRDELGASEYQRTILGKLEGPLPQLDLNAEATLGWLLRELIGRGLLTSAHDCSEGGVGVALAEMVALGRFGAEIKPEVGHDLVPWLFSETTARVVVAVAPGDLSELRDLAKGIGTPITELGMVTGRLLSIRGMPDIRALTLKEAYEQGFPRLMG
ncbi:MAG TPA: phosphoribosylformylglycinamidine synthase subunit PurL [Actinomycetota bacterium]|nr:phosphoribosylformylglycinamidine synthase subunit PurL [Actinomycetota bacterium]